MIGSDSLIEGYYNTLNEINVDYFFLLFIEIYHDIFKCLFFFQSEFVKTYLKFKNNNSEQNMILILFENFLKVD